VAGLTSAAKCTGIVTLTPVNSTTATVINVTLNVVNQAVIDVGLNSITQTAPPGSTTPIIVTVPLSSSDNSTSLGFNATVATNPAGQAWLLIPGANALSTPINLNVQLNPTNLQAGTYRGTVTIQDDRGAASAVPTQTIPVTLTVASSAFSLSNSSLTFSHTAGSSTTPPSQTDQLTTTNTAAVPFTALFNPTTSLTPPNLVTVSPLAGTVSGTTPATLTIALSQAVLSTLSAGTYGGVVSVSSPDVSGATLNVTVTVTPLQSTSPAVVNAATQRSGSISPGEVFTIYGSGIGPSTPVLLTLTPAGKVSTILGNTQVLFDGVAAPLIYVSANQINAIGPYELSMAVRRRL
jgi:hypothetical protein